jgi:hypothetical protein
MERQQLLTKQPSTPETVLTMERQHILQKPLHSHQKLYCLRKNIQKKERNRQNVKKLTIQTLSKVNQHNLDTLYMKSVSYFMIVEKLLTFVLYINLIYFGKLHGNGTLTILFSKSRKSNVENIPNVIKLMFSKIQM